MDRIYTLPEIQSILTPVFSRHDVRCAVCDPVRLLRQEKRHGTQ